MGPWTLFSHLIHCCGKNMEIICFQMQRVCGMNRKLYQRYRRAFKKRVQDLLLVLCAFSNPIMRFSLLLSARADIMQTGPPGDSGAATYYLDLHKTCIGKADEIAGRRAPRCDKVGIDASLFRLLVAWRAFMGDTGAAEDVPLFKTFRTDAPPEGGRPGLDVHKRHRGAEKFRQSLRRVINEDCWKDVYDSNRSMFDNAGYKRQGNTRALPFTPRLLRASGFNLCMETVFKDCKTKEELLRELSYHGHTGCDALELYYIWRSLEHIGHGTLNLGQLLQSGGAVATAAAAAAASVVEGVAARAAPSSSSPTAVTQAQAAAKQGSVNRGYTEHTLEEVRNGVVPQKLFTDKNGTPFRYVCANCGYRTNSLDSLGAHGSTLQW